MLVMRDATIYIHPLRRKVLLVDPTSSRWYFLYHRRRRNGGDWSHLRSFFVEDRFSKPQDLIELGNKKPPSSPWHHTASLFVKKCFLARACEVFLLRPQNDNIPDDSNSDTLELGTPFHSQQKSIQGGTRKPEYQKHVTASALVKRKIKKEAIKDHSYPWRGKEELFNGAVILNFRMQLTTSIQPPCLLVKCLSCFDIFIFIEEEICLSRVSAATEMKRQQQEFDLVNKTQLDCSPRNWEPTNRGQ